MKSRITLANTQAAALYETANKARNLKAEYDLSNNKNVSFILKTPHDVPQDILSLSGHFGERQIRHPGRSLLLPQGNACGPHAAWGTLPAPGRPY